MPILHNDNIVWIQVTMTELGIPMDSMAGWGVANISSERQSMTEWGFLLHEDAQSVPCFGQSNWPHIEGD
jgi:hypothetical protein